MTDIDTMTLELFDTISCVKSFAELNEEGQQMVFGWLLTILKIPYLDDSEKHNANVMVEYLESLEDIDDFLPMCNSVKTKLKFEQPLEWNIDWPENYQVCIDNEVLTVEDLRRRGIKYVDFSITKPIRNSLEYIITRRLYSDESVEILPEYQVFKTDSIAERHMFNIYGEKAVLAAQTTNEN